VSVRIPADVDREDRIIGNLTARQATVIAVTAATLYSGWLAARSFLPIIAYLIVAVPVGVTAAVLVVAQRDGVTLDRLLLAAIKQWWQPRRRISQIPTPVPEWLSHFSNEVRTGQLELPATGVDEVGVVDLGRDGMALVAACSTVNFSLRTASEQEALVAAFGRYLHSLTAGVQILVRTQRLDLSGSIGEIRQQAGSLPHPALENAALGHAEYLEQLSKQAELLRRHVLLVVRERPVGAQRATARLLRRVQEAAELLAPAGIDVVPLDSAQATAVLTAATNPDCLIPPTADIAGPDEVITASEEYLS
jgi:hypothetical protein